MEHAVTVHAEAAVQPTSVAAATLRERYFGHRTHGVVPQQISSKGEMSERQSLGPGEQSTICDVSRVSTSGDRGTTSRGLGEGVEAVAEYPTLMSTGSGQRRISYGPGARLSARSGSVRGPSPVEGYASQFIKLPSVPLGPGVLQVQYTVVHQCCRMQTRHACTTRPPCGPRDVHSAHAALLRSDCMYNTIESDGTRR